MFYSQEILQKRGGKFGIVWLAATRAAVLTKKDYYSVQVAKICNDLLQHITLRISQRGAKQRFSLYLSSQLMFGITKVHGKQASYLLVEVQRLHRQFSSTRLMLSESFINDPFQLPKTSRTATACTLPSPDLGHFSGAWHQEMMPPPHVFEEEYFYSGTMRGSHSFKSPDRPVSPIQELEEFSDVQPHVVSNINEITLREEEPLLPVDFQEGVLDDLTGLIGDHMEETLASVPLPDDEEFILSGIGDGDNILTSPQRHGEMWTIEEGTGKLVLSPIEKRSSKRIAKSTKESLTREGSLSPDADRDGLDKRSSDEGGPPEFKTPQSPSGQAVDVPILRLAAIREQEETPPSAPKRGRKRRRQLLFVDLKTQLSKTEIRSSMEDFEKTLERDILANPDPLPSVKELFSEPGRKAAKMSPTLVELWREGSKFRPPLDNEPEDRIWSLDYLREPEPGLSSSPEYDLPEVPELGRGDVSTEQLRGHSSKIEDSRMSSKMDDTPASLNITDVARLSQSREGSRQGSFIAEPGMPRLRRAEESIEEEGLIGRDGSLIETLPQLDELLIPEGPELGLIEESVQIGEDFDVRAMEMSTSEDEDKGIPHEQLYQKIAELTPGDEGTSFQELVPLSTDRKVAAKIFATCLEYAKDGLISVRQSKAFSDIFIYRRYRMEV
ncbi:meiotic recombination protein REC8 homolog isoform X2 [Apostichopus japonicus]|uniref:meiotic recombination protein REC8 homolog isoform X2 n=1 Tax=Stichopus japonicus TaxID=307972 RepID=UPI003AB53354